MVAVKTAEGGRWILPQIASLRNRGAEVVVLLPEGEGRLATAVSALTLEDEGVQLLRTVFDFSFRPGLRLLPQLLDLRRTIVAARVDAILYHLYATALALRLASLGLKVRRVHMIAGPLFLESPLIAMFERVLWRSDDHIICGSRFIFERYAKLGVPRRHMSVVPYGVSTERFASPSPAERARARAELGLPAEGLVAVMVSYVYAPKRLAHRGRAIKGHEVLLEAWQGFSWDHPDARLLLVGGGFDAAGERHRQQVIRRFAAGARANSTLWLDSLDDVRFAYRAGDVSISPSLSDNHGAVLEASAMGLPSLVSDAGALSEAVEHGSGWVHRAGSSSDLRRCLEECAAAASAGELRRRGVTARDYVAEYFDANSCAELVADLILEPARQGTLDD